MRRLTITLILLLCMALGVSAATGATNVSGFSTIHSDGKCQTTLTATLHIESDSQALKFPVPINATGITVNGSRVRTSRVDDTLVINLSNALGNITGDVSVTISYTLKDVIYRTEADTLEMRLPMLSGFNHPISKMEFSITLPGPVEGRPTFSSGYHQTNIEKDLTYGIEGATIAGSFLTELKDHETLTMTLPVTAQMFPQSVLKAGDPTATRQLCIACGVIALLYWLLCLRNLPPLGKYHTQPPEGQTAGELGSILCLKGMDLSLTVLSWAQLGYVTITLDRHGKVLLRKRMEMGNERKEWERRWFLRLFNRRDTVDTAGLHYASLCLEAAKHPGGMGERMHRKTGNLRVFRGIAAGIGLFGGITLGIYLGGGAALQGLLVFLLAVAGGISGWYLQGFAYGLVSRTHNTVLCLCIIAAWLVLSLLGSCFSFGLSVVAALLAAGLLLAFGGRRTDLGRQDIGEILGLNRHLRTVTKTELQRLHANDPEYFFTLAPYAISLGCGKAFAKRFGGIRLPPCPYLTTGMDAHRNAAEWMQVLNETLSAMDGRSQKLPLERFIAFLQGLRKA